MRNPLTVMAFGLLLAIGACAMPPGQQGGVPVATYDNEAQDFGLAPTTTIRTSDFEAPTPMAVNGATTVTTIQLRDMIQSAHPPVVIDVLGGNQTVSLPGAVWIRGAGLGSSVNDDLQQHLVAKLAELTGGDRTRPVAFLCLSRTCWLSHNAAVRAVASGYRNVLWYRGGRAAWIAAGLPMAPVRAVTL